MLDDVCELTERVLISGIREWDVAELAQHLASGDPWTDRDKREIQLINGVGDEAALGIECERCHRPLATVAIRLVVELDHQAGGHLL